jgi:Ca2+/Na+ antiporter
VEKVKIGILREKIKKILVKPEISIPLMVSDFLLLCFSFCLMNYIKRGSFRLSSEYQSILLLIVGLWLIVSNVDLKFDKNNLQNYYYAMTACVKSVLLMGAAMSVVIFAFRLFYFSRLHIFGTFLMLLFFESMVYYFYFIFSNEKVPLDIESVEEIHDFFGQKKLPVQKESQTRRPPSHSFMSILMDNCLRAFPDFFEFVKNSVDIEKFRGSEISIMSSPDIFNVKIIKNHSLKLLINFHKLNDIRWINRYFLEIHEKLANGAYLVGRAQTADIHKENFFKKYPKYYAEVLYLLHFVFYRIFPKIPKIRKIYFSLTKGKSRILSRAEILGRLYFCGFKVLAERQTDDSFFFIAKKVKTPSLDQNPSYGPLLRLKRIGLNGQSIYVYKFRTMYPYSEYLQKYIYQHHKLSQDGKINNDFRVTEWGKFMRKYWLDEIPMIFNWVKGDVKLFGVRPLSKHYLSLYEKHLREMRRKVKPGIIPPFYADLPHRFRDIIESERKYILAYEKHPFRTQVVYFWRALSNIIIKGARSG